MQASAQTTTKAKRDDRAVLAQCVRFHRQARSLQRMYEDFGHDDDPPDDMAIDMLTELENAKGAVAETPAQTLAGIRAKAAVLATCVAAQNDAADCTALVKSICNDIAAL
jgi:hypothetical protein